MANFHLIEFSVRKPNARHHPPRVAAIGGKFSMEVSLFAVGCLPLLGGRRSRRASPAWPYKLVKDGLARITSKEANENPSPEILD